MDIDLLNLKSRFDSYPATPASNQVLAWSAANARYEPVPLKTVGGALLTGAGDITGGDKSSFLVVDLAYGTPIALSGDVDLDGYSPLNSTVLVYGQTDPSENGVYHVDGAGVWTRAATATEMFGRFVFVSNGSVDRNKFFRNSNGLLPVLGTDDVTFEEFTFQKKLVNTQTIKSVNGNSLLGVGNITVSASPTAFGNILTELTLDTDSAVGSVMYLKAPSTLVACKNNVGGTNVRLGLLIEAGLAGETRSIASIGSTVDASSFGSWVKGTTYYVQPDFTVSAVVNGAPFLKALTSSLVYILEP